LIQELKGQELYDKIAHSQIDPKIEYYKCLVKYKDQILYDTMIIGQKDMAIKLNISQAKLSPIINILKAL
jgi:hypothetical protein